MGFWLKYRLTKWYKHQWYKSSLSEPHPYALRSNATACLITKLKLVLIITLFDSHTKHTIYNFLPCLSCIHHRIDYIHIKPMSWSTYVYNGADGNMYPCMYFEYQYLNHIQIQLYNIWNDFTHTPKLRLASDSGSGSGSGNIRSSTVSTAITIVYGILVIFPRCMLI